MKKLLAGVLLAFTFSCLPSVAETAAVEIGAPVGIVHKKHHWHHRRHWHRRWHHRHHRKVVREVIVIKR
jgi:hypothetical protein